MKYYYKLFLWENGQKSTDLSNYLIAPIFFEDKLNEELDTGEIILDDMPVETKYAFPPKTKFRLERHLTDEQTDTSKIWDMIVEHDDVEEYVGVEGKCCHRISLIEVSAIMQGMHVDNIALTYELQDVSLNYKTYTQDTTRLNDLVSVINGADYSPIKQPEDPDSYFDYGTGIGSTSKYNYFRNSYAYKWRNLETLRSLYLNLASNESHNINFEIPQLICQGCPNGGSFEDLFEINTVTRVWRTETLFNSPVEGTRTLLIEKENGATELLNTSNSSYYIENGKAYLRKLEEWGEGSIWEEAPYYDQKDKFSNHYIEGFLLASSSVTYNNKNIQFEIPSLNVFEIEQGKGYLYEIEIFAKPSISNSMVEYYSVKCFAESKYYPGSIIGVGDWGYRSKGEEEQCIVLNPNSIYIKTTFNVTDLSSEAVGGPLLMKGVKYSCYDLLRKALLTVDTQLINNDEIGIDDIEYFLILDPAWENRLKTYKVQETILENKNLWEVLIQIGYYLHAIPYISFSEDGTDRFLLSFRQLGDIKKKNDTSNKITIFNSKNLNNYFTQYDSYVTNLFSPQNLVDEWLVVKSNDATALIYNNNAIIKTSYNISEIVAFDINYDGSAGGESGTKSALNYIFEKSIYEILTSEYNVSPGKGDSLYYELGTNLIEGLTYTPPTPDGSVMPFALKRIVGKIFSGVSTKDLKYNNLSFHITYRTQDTMRISQVRPNLQDFLKNSSYEKYTHNEQYFGQQDKIIDSERFSRNLFGKLIRVGNDIYQRQEYVIDGNDKESGDLIEINGEPYYVTVIENEFYPDATLQKVTYSKNYNQLSQIVTIPSEPRFYEVSERSKIRREVRFFDFLSISTNKPSVTKTPRYLKSDSWQKFIKDLIFADSTETTIPNYTWIRFQADKKRIHTGSYGQYVPPNQMFPSVEIDRTNPNQIMPKESSDHADVIVPLLHFPLQDGIIFECDMEDNFKAGDSTDTTINGKNDTVDEAYYALQSVRYCDVLGRADLLCFRMFYKDDWTHDQSQQLPKAAIEPTEEMSQLYIPEPLCAVLEKDCRCMISLNCQVCLLYRNDDGNGDYVTFSNIFGEKSGRLNCCLLDKEVSMFDENTSVISGTVLKDNISYNLLENYQDGYLEIKFTTPSDIQLESIKSIVFYEIDDENNRVSYLAKNFKNGISGESIPTFYIYPVFNDN